MVLGKINISQPVALSSILGIPKHFRRIFIFPRKEDGVIVRRATKGRRLKEEQLQGRKNKVNVHETWPNLAQPNQVIWNSDLYAPNQGGRLAPWHPRCVDQTHLV